jgi:hypothetical protein
MQFLHGLGVPKIEFKKPDNSVIILRSSGHILLLTTVKYALYATINPFMAYLAYAFGDYSDAAVFALMS